MPINSAHEELIHGSLDDYIELPKDEKQLRQEIARISQAYHGPQLKLEDSLSFIQRPTERLVNLEKHGAKEVKLKEKDNKSNEKKEPSLKIGEVKLYVLDMLDKAIVKAANEIKLTLDDSIWNAKSIENKIKSDSDFNQEFKTQLHLPTVSQLRHPYAIPYSDDQLYKAWISTNNDGMIANIEIDLNIPSEKPTHITIDGYRVIPLFNDEDPKVAESKYVEFITKLEQEALSPTNDIVRQRIYNHLVKSHIISESEIYRVSPGTMLLTYSYYYKALVDGLLKFNTFYQTNMTEASTLSHSSAITLLESKKSDYDRVRTMSIGEINILGDSRLCELIENEVVSMETMLKLGQSQRQVISDTYYRSLFNNIESLIEEVKALSEQQCKFFLIPNIKNLITIGKISFDQLKNMSLGTVKVLCNEFYYQRITRGDLDYTQISDLDETTGDLLILTSVIKLAGNDIRAIEEMIKLPVFSKLLILSDKRIQYLIGNDLLACDDAARIQHKISAKTSGEFKSPDTKEMGKLKTVMHDCKRLLASGMLYDADLHYMFEKLSAIPDMKKEKNIENEKSSENTLSLLRYEPMMKICNLNIKDRLLAILNYRPQEFYDQIDSIQKLIQDCKSTDLTTSLALIQKEELDCSLKSSYYSTGASILDRVVVDAKRMGLEKQDVFERLFGTRLKAIYDRLPCKLIDETKDNLQRLQTELQIVAKNAGISASKIRSLAMKHLLIATKIQLEKELDIKKDDCPKLYKDTYLEICKAEKSDLEAKESAKEEIWSKSFASVVTTAKLYLSVDELKHSDITSKSNESKRPISSLFLPQQPITSALRKREFCHQFELIEKFIPEKTAQLKAMSKAVMR